MNPQDDDSSRQYLQNEIIGIEGANVTDAPTHVSGDDVRHHVKVRPDTFDQSIPADVRISHQGDVCIPTEGSRVVIGYRPNGRALVLGGRYAQGDTIPPFEPGERIVGHPTTDSEVHLHNDGSVTVEGDSGNTIELGTDGTVTINDGNTAPVTNIETTKDADGDINDITLIRADGVFVPTQ